jgi:hypothetical protein
MTTRNSALELERQRLFSKWMQGASFLNESSGLWGEYMLFGVSKKEDLSLSALGDLYRLPCFHESFDVIARSRFFPKKR